MMPRETSMRGQTGLFDQPCNALNSYFDCPHRTGLIAGMAMTIVDPVDETAAEEAHPHPVPTHQAVMERTLTPRAATLATDDVEGAVVCILTPDNSSRH